MAPALTPEQLEQALQGISVPAQPQIMVDLQMELYMPDPDLPAIARLIAQDPGLAGAVLKVANSPLFTQGEPLVSVEQAVAVLGAQAVIALINAQSIKGEMADETIVTLNRFWDSAQDVASTSAALARHLGVPLPEQAYALGLFHDCGVPLMLKRFPGYMAVLENAYAAASDGQRIVDTENRTYNTNHAVVGYYTARAWRLPTLLCTAIANHHNVLAVLDQERRHTPLKNLLVVLKMAEHISHAYQVLGGQADDHEWNRIGAQVLDYAGLSEYDFDNLRETLRELSAR